MSGVTHTTNDMKKSTTGNVKFKLWLPINMHALCMKLCEKDGITFSELVQRVAREAIFKETGAVV